MKTKIKNFFFAYDNEELSLKERFIRFIKSPKEVIKFLLPIFILIILFIPLPYSINIGGGIINLSDKIETEYSYDQEGSLNMAYVSVLKGNVLTYLSSFLIPESSREKVVDNIETEDFSDHLALTTSTDVATFVAYQTLGLKCDEIRRNIYIVKLDPSASNELKVKDQILAIDNKEVLDSSMIKELIKDKDEVIVKVKRNNKELYLNVKLFKESNESKLGVYINESIVYEKSPNITFNFSDQESGPSGGLMLALSIYNKLSKDDITKGKTIVGTGTISLTGEVGAIGGVKYKLMGANKIKADIFLVPHENYEEAIAFKEEKGYNIEVIEVSSFTDALEKLTNKD